MRLINADYLKEHLAACAMNGRPLHSIFAELTEVLDAIDEVPTVTADEDTVSRQKMINTVNNMRTRCDNDINAYHDLMVTAIEVLPPSPSRPHGQWIDRNDNVATCSVCGERWGLYRMLNFCPNCGSDMRQEGGAV